MPFKKGESGNPDGRPTGARNKQALVVEDLTAKAITEGLMPLDFFLQVLRNNEMPLGFRFECGKAAAPYVHKKMPIMIENLDAPFKVLDIATLEGLSDDELETLQRIMAKAADAEAKRIEAPLDPRVINLPPEAVQAVAKAAGVPTEALTRKRPAPKKRIA